MDPVRAKRICCASIMIITAAVFGQNVLTGDTLFIGQAAGHPGEQVIVPVGIRTSGVYQGWQIPLRFGDGSGPLHCDSVSIANSCMSSIPHKWDFIAPFHNNNEWNNEQRCGIAGVVDMTPPYEWLPPGDYAVLDLYFSIDSGAQSQTVILDTATSSWYSGGPPNAYVISQDYQSWVTIVEPGAVEVLASAVADPGKGERDRCFMLTPSLVSKGQTLMLAFSSGSVDAASVSVVDACGRIYRRLIREGPAMTISTAGLPSGAYFVIVSTGRGRATRKFVVK